MTSKVNLLLLLLLIGLPRIVVGQISNDDVRNMRVMQDLERESRPYRGSATDEVDGDPYLWTRWSPGSVTLYREDKFYEIPGLKYDVLNHGIDVMFDKERLKSLDGNLVKEFEYKDSLTQLPHRFINAKDFTRDGVALKGFLEVLCWGKVDVYSFTEAALLKPNYNVAVGSGHKNYQISKKRSLVYSPGSELRPLSKKELTKLWAEKETEMNKFQKINKLNPTRERDLMLMVDYFNTL